ncbi:MAG: universal stress protein [Deltaproteobacteria bacterium CG_4_10_14_3_um_filter_60_8]|nr:MAG: universal stress protein [Deltaproteobacteria bacterium CG_4_10_14_3_um_filter_60_8]
MNEYKRILVVSRMIQSSRKAIHYGVSLAKKYNAELYVIHSIYNPFGLRGWSLGTLSLEKEYATMLRDAKRKLSGIIAAEKTKGITIKELVREGEPTEEILKTIEQEKIDLLVMLAHEEGHLEDLFSNRSNDELVRKMPCSILLVKQEPGAILDQGDEEDEDEDLS